MGPFDVNVTDAGSGVQVIVTDEVEHPNVTVPLNPGIAVNTSPIASLPPGGTGGNDPPGGGVTVIVIGEFETVSSVEPLTSFWVADIVVVRPAVGPVVARPPSSLIVAASGFDDAHATVDVMSFVLLSENVPVAVNCRFELIGSVGFVGVTAMDVSVAAFSVNVAFTICAVAGIVNVHVALVLFGQMLLQPPNPEPAFGVSISVT